VTTLVAGVAIYALYYYQRLTATSGAILFVVTIFVEMGLGIAPVVFGQQSDQYSYRYFITDAPTHKANIGMILGVGCGVGIAVAVLVVGVGSYILPRPSPKIYVSSNPEPTPHAVATPPPVAKEDV